MQRQSRTMTAIPRKRTPGPA